MDKSEILLQSIQTLIDKSLEDLQFTTTEIATIIDATEAAQGKYVVSNGNISYTAYSDNSMYKEKDQVQINIPNNDFNQVKTILGKMRVTSQEPINYQRPSDKVLITQIINTSSNEVGIKANGQDILKNCGLYQNIGEHSEKLVIKADFKTLLKDYALSSGTYGLLITITEQGTNQEYKYTFSNKSMIGDIYNFETYFSQDYVIDVSDISIIDKIQLQLFQMNDFKDYNGSSIPINQTNDNIFVKNIYIALGYDVSDIQEDKLLLTSPVDDYAQVENQIPIKLNWAHIDANNKISNVTDPSTLDPCMICWYISEDTLDPADQYSGIGWKIANLDVEHPYKFSYDIANNKFIIGNQTTTEINLNNYHSMLYNLPYINKLQVKVKAILFLGNERYQSNTLIFSNGKYQEPEEEQEEDSGLNIKFNSSIVTFRITQPLDDNGYYLFYNSDGSLNESYTGADSITRTILPFLNNSLVDTNNYAVTWQCEQNFITRLTGITSADGFIYNIKQSINTRNSLNKEYIYCTITNKSPNSNESYTGICELYFGQTANGTNNSFGAQLFKGKMVNGEIMYEAVNAYTLGDKDKYFVKPFLIRNGSIVTPESVSIKNNWPLTSGTTANYFEISTEVVEKGYYPLILKEPLENVPVNNHSIFQFTTIVESNTFDCVLPIPIRKNEKYNVFGTLYLNYGQSTNSTPNFAQTYIDCINKENNNNFTAQVYSGSDPWGIIITTSNTYNNHQYKIYGMVTSYRSNTTMSILNGMDDGECVYSTPFVITLQRFGINILNQWDNQLLSNKEENYILAATIGAGVKNQDNSFSGVVMGKLDELSINNGDAFEFGSDTMTGLYGFDKGALTYAFREDGSSFLGGKGTIQSLNYLENSGGMPVSGTKIDLANGAIKSDSLTIQDIFKVYPKNIDGEGYIELLTDKLFLVNNYGEDNKSINLNDIVLNIDKLNGEVSTTITSIADISANAVDKNSEEYQNLITQASASMDSEAVNFAIENYIDNNGTKTLDTGTGYRFDLNGLTIDTNVSATKSLLNETGLEVIDKNTNEPLLIVGIKDKKNGCYAKNLEATTYLIVGKNSRFEDWRNSKGDRTACFWLG